MSTDRATATKGELQRLREQIRFTEKSKDILKMKRDQLAGEINRLLVKIQRRKNMENMFDEAFMSVKYAYTIQGYDAVSSIANASNLIEVRASTVSVMGVIMPEIEIIKKTDHRQISSTVLYIVAKKLTEAVKEAIEIAVIEARIEQLARDLTETNRKVNALEKIIIPRYKSMAKYIEDRLIEEDLEEFSVTKHVRDLIRERRE